jgi:hypothetical protein
MMLSKQVVLVSKRESEIFLNHPVCDVIKVFYMWKHCDQRNISGKID